MRIGVNLGTLRGFGSGNVGRGLLNAILKDQSNHEFFIWHPVEWADQNLECIGSRVNLFSTHPGIVNKYIDENLKIRYMLEKHRIDCLLSLTDTSSLNINIPHVLMIHQPFLLYPFSSWNFPIPSPFRLKMNIMRHYLSLCLKTTTTVSVQTNTMKNRFLDQFEFNQDNVIVVPSAFDSDFATSSEDILSPTEPPYFCYIASAACHKNHDIIPLTIKALRERGNPIRCKVTIESDSIPEFSKKARELGVEDSIDFLGPLPKPAAMQLLKESKLMMMPSHLETFGLPYFEAMELGVPIVASDYDFAREACDDAAIYAQSDDPKMFANGINEICTSDSTRNDLIQKGQICSQQKKISWQNILEIYIAHLASLTLSNTIIGNQ